MKRNLAAYAETWPIRGNFAIARGAKTEAGVVVVQLESEGNAGKGECVPYGRYGESVKSVLEQIEAVRHFIESGAEHAEILAAMAPGAARNAVDCCLWDLDAKCHGGPVHQRICANPPRPVVTAMTISLGEPEEMALQARSNASRPLLKVKLGGGDSDAERMHAVATAAPDSGIILDANESWREDNFRHLMLEAASVGARLIEQPLPAGEDQILGRVPHPVPVCADESAHVTADLEALLDRYDCVNIKLDKTGGLTEAITMRDHAHSLGFSVMVGCMVSTSLSMAPAVLLAQDVEFVDLDGPLILARDRPHGLRYSNSIVSPPQSELWG